MNRVRTWVALLVVALAGVLVAPSVCAQSPLLAQAAFERHQAVSLHKWRFDRVRNVDGATWRERCVGVDFRKAECRLKAVDEQPPNDAALAAYEEDVAQPVERNLPNIDLSQFVDVAQVTPMEQDGNEARYAFAPLAETPEDEAFVKHQRGVLRVDREESYVRQLSVESTGPFKPSTGVKIHAFSMQMHFAQVADTPMASRVEIDVRGRAFLVKKFEQTEVVLFEHFVAPI